MARSPRSDIEARRRILRKLDALKSRSEKLLLEAAGLWEEGQVSTAIDYLRGEIESGIEFVVDSIDEEIERHREEA
jgi:hypothetical protein